MEMFQGLFESQEKIEVHIKTLIELSRVNGVVGEGKVAYIQTLAVAYGVNPMTIDFNNTKDEMPQILNTFTEYKSKMCLLQDLISLAYVDGKFSSVERAFVVSTGECLGIAADKVNKLLELNNDYIDVNKRLGDLLMLEELTLEAL